MKLNALRGLLLPLLLLAAWEYASRQSTAGAYAFVPLAQVGAALAELLAMANCWSTCGRACCAPA